MIMYVTQITTNYLAIKHEDNKPYIKLNQEVFFYNWIYVKICFCSNQVINFKLSNEKKPRIERVNKTNINAFKYYMYLLNMKLKKI